MNKTRKTLTKKKEQDAGVFLIRVKGQQICGHLLHKIFAQFPKNILLVNLQYADLVSRGATVKLDQVVGARLQTGKRVSISNLNGPRDESLACGITSNLTSHAVLSRYLIIINNRCRCHRSSTPQKPRKKDARRASAPIFRALIILMTTRRFACLLQV